jgi:hypothetical protein
VVVMVVMTTMSREAMMLLVSFVSSEATMKLS